MVTKFDRSRSLAYQSCPRKRYLGYNYGGKGIVANKVNIPLTVGSCTHLGLETLLNEAKLNLSSSVYQVNLAVEKALALYDSECRSRSFAQEDLDLSFVYQENRALIEALIRLYAKIQLPRLLERFEVLEVEKEIEVALVEHRQGCLTTEEDGSPCTYCDGKGYIEIEDSLILMSRPDAILREHSTSSIYVLSFKTSSMWLSDISEHQNRWDVQGISELIAVEEWLDGLVDSFEEEQIIRVSGIKMEYLIKGSYSKSLSDQPLMNISKGQRFYNSLLIHPYANQEQFVFGTDLDLRFEYEWQDSITGKTSRLGKNWKRCNLWELGETAIADWIDFLAEQEDGLRLLERMIVCPIEYYRNDEDVKEWLESTTFQEQRIQQDLEAVENGELSLNQCFSKTRGSCFSYNSVCQYAQICWEGLTPEQLLETGEFRIRDANHENEFEV